jgi:hemerythrin-like metal-binding protein
MRLIQWSNANAVYLPEIDAEHRSLLQTADALHQAILAGARPERIQTILRNLLIRAEEHFLHEERRMQEVGCPSYNWHKMQHDTFRKRAKTVAKRVERGNGEAAIELLRFFAGWLRDHTAIADRMMGAYLRNYQLLHTKAS